MISSRFRERRQAALTCRHCCTTAFVYELAAETYIRRWIILLRFVAVRNLIKHPTIRWLLLLAACLVVFFFAFHAKVGAYDHGLGAKPTAATASKLWADGQKAEVPSITSTLIVLWFAVILLYKVHLCRAPRIVKPRREPALARVSLLGAHSFRRPPPAR